MPFRRGLLGCKFMALGVRGDLRHLGGPWVRSHWVLIERALPSLVEKKPSASCFPEGRKATGQNVSLAQKTRDLSPHLDQRRACASPQLAVSTPRTERTWQGSPPTPPLRSCLLFPSVLMGLGAGWLSLSSPETLNAALIFTLKKIFLSCFYSRTCSVWKFPG